jgi:hypothetical protein
MSDSSSSAEEEACDMSVELIKEQLELMDERLAKFALLAIAQACVQAVAASDVEQKYHIVGALQKVFGIETFRALADNQAQLYGEPWERWTE